MEQSLTSTELKAEIAALRSVAEALMTVSLTGRRRIVDWAQRIITAMEREQNTEERKQA